VTAILGTLINRTETNSVFSGTEHHWWRLCALLWCRLSHRQLVRRRPSLSRLAAVAQVRLLLLRFTSQRLVVRQLLWESWIDCWSNPALTAQRVFDVRATMMANESSSQFTSFLADDDAAVHAMMSDEADNRTSSSDAAAEDRDASCGAYNWPVLFLFTIVVAAIGMTFSALLTAISVCRYNSVPVGLSDLPGYLPGAAGAAAPFLKKDLQNPVRQIGPSGQVSPRRSPSCCFVLAVTHSWMH